MPEIKQYTRQTRASGFVQRQNTQGAFGEGVGRALQGLGDQLDQYAYKKAKSDYVAKISQLKLDNLRAKEELRTQDFGDIDIGEAYLKNFEERASQYEMSPLVGDQWQVDLANMKSEFLNEGLQENARREGVRAKEEWETSYSNWSNIVSNDPSSASEAKDNLAEIIMSNPTLTPEEKEFAIQKINVDFEQREIESKAINNPYAALQEIKSGKYSGNKGSGKFEDIMPIIQGIEGGYVKNDGNSGYPAIYGINKKWHKDAFEKALKITETKGEQAGKDFAASYYKKEFWDKNNIDSLPQEVRGIVFDATINHWGGFVSDLKDAAKNGASPSQLIQMRKAEYNRLAKSDPEKYGPSLSGWMKRLADVSPTSAVLMAETQNKLRDVAFAKIIETDPVKATEIANQNPDFIGKENSDLAQNAILQMQEEAQKTLESKAIMSDVKTWNKFINNEMSLAEVQSYPDGDLKSLMLASAEKKIPKKSEFEKANIKYQLDQEQLNLSEQWSSDDYKINTKNLKAYKDFKSKVFKAAQDGYITGEKASDYVSKYNAEYLGAIASDKTDSDYFVRLGGIEAPYKQAFKSINKIFKDTGVEDNVVLKSKIIESFENFLPADYESKGYAKDKVVIDEAMSNALREQAYINYGYKPNENDTDEEIMRVIINGDDKMKRNIAQETIDLAYNETDIPSFKTVEELNTAGLPAGTVVMVGGVRGKVTK